MLIKSIIEKKELDSACGHPDSPAPKTSDRSLDALWKRLEVAEAKVCSLESENEQLRLERTRAVLAAARATKQPNDHHESVSHEPESNYESLTKELKLAETARAEAARERQGAIEAVTEASKKEYSQKIAIIQARHADELAALRRMAEKQAHGAVAKELDALASVASDSKKALIIAKREHTEDLHILEEKLNKKYEEQVAALHRHYATKLENLLRDKKEQFATELMSSLSSARASWQEDTTKRLEEAAKAAEGTVKKERKHWQQRHKLALLRAAHVWRRRERRRFLEARAQWKLAQRQAIDACNKRWKTKFDRLGKQASLMASFSRAFTVILERIKSRAISLSSQQTLANGVMACQNALVRPSRIQAGLIAVVIVFLGINLSLTAGLPTDANERATDEKVPSSDQVASAPAGKSEETSAMGLGLAKQVTTGNSDIGKFVVSRDPRTDRVRSTLKGQASNAGTTRKPVMRHPARQTVVRPDKRQTEQMIRERLRANIRNLRMGRTAN